MTTNFTSPYSKTKTLPFIICLLLFSSHLTGDDESKQNQIIHELSKLNNEIADIESSYQDDPELIRRQYYVSGNKVIPDLNDIKVYAKAIEWILRHQEFSKKSTHDHTLKVIASGLERTEQLKQSSLNIIPGIKYIAAYQSKVDRSIQPYVLSLPKNYDHQQKFQKHPLVVVLHGRGGLNEVGFIHRHQGKPVGTKHDWIQIDVFGRIDNAYRWAGETDVFEAIADVSQRFRIDRDRISLWGFSMGGAGAWHLALHYPTYWASAGAGAGFVDFYKYQRKSSPLADYQHRPLHIYDSINYGLNLANVPFVTYGGELDKQLQSSQFMIEEAKRWEVPLKFILGKGTGHKFTPEGKDEFLQFLWKHNQQGRETYPGPKSIKFITFTPKYHQCGWLSVEELEVQYSPALVQGDLDDSGNTLIMTTENVAAIKINRDVADEISIDDSEFMPLRSAAENRLPEVYFEMDNQGRWLPLTYDESREFQDNVDIHKRPNLQGPIDDAFMDSFVCVRGTGTPWSAEHEQWANWKLSRFESEFNKWMRGRIQIVNDQDVTEDMINRNHLILFGDPGSNQLIAKVLNQMPFSWTKDAYSINGKSYSTKDHGCALIYPNPMNSNRYVVLNSGMTTHEQDFKNSNSYLYPKLGDLAIQKFLPSKKGYEESIEEALIFDRYWKIPESD